MHIGIEQYLATIDPTCGLLYDRRSVRFKPRILMADVPTPFPSLLGRARAVPRDEAAWDELVARFDRVLVGIACHVVRRSPGLFPDATEEALEVSMLVWVRLCQHENRALKNFRGDTEESFLAYLATLTRNIIRDRIRRATAQRRPQMTEVPDFDLDAPDPRSADGAFHLTELREQLTRALLGLWEGKPAAYRNVVLCQLAIFHEVSAERIAAIAGFGLTRGGVEKIVAQGRKRVQDLARELQRARRKDAP